ncbi:MAG: exonuclease SbcCD subunit D [Oscillospiraceae bacterium]|nr:exonuclease SbcCD subunit D [Oscillospiraceae bacterium]
MRFLHLADLHLGKTLHKQNLLADQRFILQQILETARTREIDAVLIAGDVYQRNAPSADAMTLFSDFLAALADMQLPVYVISGNHDSAERVAYLSEIAAHSGIRIAGADSAAVYSYPAEDAYGSLTVHLMPFTAPLQVRQKYPDEADGIRSYDDAIRVLLSHYPLPDDGGRHIMVAHQFLTGGAVCESEELAIGGLDNISAALFDGYDYVALGHLHGPQYVSRPEIRYAGSPLKYSFSEVHQHKSVTIADIREKGNVTIETVSLTPLHEMQELTGTLDALMQHEPTEDYLHVILTDDNPPSDAVRMLRTVFPNLLQMTVQNTRMRADYVPEEQTLPQRTDFAALLTDFYAAQNQGAEPTEQQMQIVRDLLEQLDREAGAL